MVWHALVALAHRTPSYLILVKSCTCWHKRKEGSCHAHYTTNHASIDAVLSQAPTIPQTTMPPIISDAQAVCDLLSSLPRPDADNSLPPEDWDHLEPLTIDHHHSTMVNTTASAAAPSRVVFPSSQGGCNDNDASVPPEGGCSRKRTLSKLLKLHTEKGTNIHFTTEEVARLEETLGQWVSFFFNFVVQS